MKICAAPDCGKLHYGKGYCYAHYERLKRHGNPLGGRTPNGEPLRFIHEVALNHVGDGCLTWPFGKISSGYGMVWVDDKMARAHRYVCELVHGSPPTPEHEAAHRCGKGHEGCIAPGHLIWKTSAENKADMLLHGTRARGERHGCVKLTEAAVREILTLKGIETQSKLAARFGVDPTTISYIHTGRSWAWLDKTTGRERA